MRNCAFIPAVFLILGLAGAAFAQRWVNPHFDTHRMDFRDLGYPEQNLIPADNSRVSALLAHSNGLIYGATSGRTQAYLFFYNRYINKVRPLGKIADARGVYHGLLEGRDGEVLIGTGLSMFAPVELTKDFPVELDGIEKQLWKDITAPYKDFAGGHLYRYDPQKGDRQRYTSDSAAPLEDLGIPVKHNTIYAMALSPDKATLYGLTYPDAHFFIFDLQKRAATDLGEILSHKVYGGPERHWRSVPRALFCDPATGDVYTSGDNGFLVRYRPATGKIEPTFMRLPGEYWEGLSSYDYPVVEAFAAAPDGNVYAGTSDGYLIRLDIKKDTVVVLGKPRVMRRLRGMAAGQDGNLYLITGEFERMCKLHTWDLGGSRGFSELGPFAVDRSPYYSRRAYQMDAIAVGPDGTIFCGESDRGGKLFLYMPGPGCFKERLNPANPEMERQRPDTPGLIQEHL
jgi:hypothetical protein